MARTPLEIICDAIRRPSYRISDHANAELDEDDLEEPDVLAATLRGEVIEGLPRRLPLASLPGADASRHA